MVEGQDAARRVGGWISGAYVDRLHVEVFFNSRTMTFWCLLVERKNKRKKNNFNQEYKVLPWFVSCSSLLLNVMKGVQDNKNSLLIKPIPSI